MSPWLIGLAAWAAGSVPLAVFVGRRLHHLAPPDPSG